MRTLRFAKEERKSERERERESPRERARASSEESTPREEGPPHKISNLLVLDPRRERERDRIKTNHSFVPCTSRIA